MKSLCFFRMFLLVIISSLVACSSSTSNRSDEQKPKRAEKPDVTLSFQGIAIGQELSSVDFSAFPDSLCSKEETKAHLEIDDSESAELEIVHWTSIITLDNEEILGGAYYYSNSNRISRIIFSTTILSSCKGLVELYERKYGEPDSVQETSDGIFEKKYFRWDFANDKSLIIGFRHYIGKDYFQALSRKEKDLILEAKRREIVEVQYRDLSYYNSEQKAARLQAQKEAEQNKLEAERQKIENAKKRANQDI